MLLFIKLIKHFFPKASLSFFIKLDHKTNYRQFEFCFKILINVAAALTTLLLHYHLYHHYPRRGYRWYSNPKGVWVMSAASSSITTPEVVMGSTVLRKPVLLTTRYHFGYPEGLAVPPAYQKGCALAIPLTPFGGMG